MIKNGTPIGGLILQSPYTSLKELIKEKISIVSNFLGIDGWNNLEIMISISCPILFMHGQQDNLIPIQHSIHLHAKSISKYKHLEEIEYADHNSIHRETILEHVRTFLDTYFNSNDSINTQQEINVDEKYRSVPNEFKQQSNDSNHYSSISNNLRSSTTSVSSFLPSSSSSLKHIQHSSSANWNGRIITGFYIDDDMDDTDKIIEFYPVQSYNGNAFIVCRTNCCKVFQCHLTSLDGSLTINVERCNWRSDNNEVLKMNQ